VVPVTDRTPELLDLARDLGVATDFHDWQGRPVDVPTETIVAVLRALGIDAATPEAARAALDDRRLAAWRRLLPPCLVTRERTPTTVQVHLDDGDPVEVWVELEDGSRRDDLRQRMDAYIEPRRVDGRMVGVATFDLPGDLPLGWHALHARTPREESSCTLVVTPVSAGLPDALGDQRAWGYMVQLYSLRSRDSWGIGDLHDLAELAGWSAAEQGAGFVLINPLHAAEPVAPMEPSPYLPTTRRFVNPVYARVEDVPEYATMAAAGRIRVDELARTWRAVNGTDAQLDRDGVWEAKREALALVHAEPRTAEREAAYDAFLRREGQGLVDFATWCALAERHGPAWREWPEQVRDPRSPGVTAAREELADVVDLHCWMQWVLDEQLATAQRTATGAGMPLGIMHDLAVGVHRDGADTWALQSVLAAGVNVGAPPDAFNQVGQDWSQPPWRPDALAQTGYAAYRDMLRTLLRHAGGLRIDHAIGLFRLWWVPQGSPASEGTYVRYDSEALLGILALEAHRAGAVVVGEDLGTVEPWMREALAERGLLGTSILWFERDDSGKPRPAEGWRELCLATVTTHDLPPSAGYLAGEHIRIRDSLGLLTRSVEEEREVDAREQAEWLEALRSRGLLSAGADEQETVEALHRYLTQTPSRLLGVAVPDAVGDRRAQNQPGTGDEYPNWRLPLADGDGRPVLLEDLKTSERARSLAKVIADS
jgi:4-alpha-glucanotransferase